MRQNRMAWWRMLLTKGLFIVLVLWISSSCKMINPSVMLRTGNDYAFNELKQGSGELYKISASDNLFFTVQTNNGEKLLDPTTMQQSQMNSQQGVNYVVEHDGTVNFPLIGRTHIAGKTIREAEEFLAVKFSDYFNKPFVQLRVTNSRVFVFTGGNTANVVPLEKSNTTLYEVLAHAGGIGDSKAHSIKLIRTRENKQEVYKIDLSRIENAAQGNIILQANDIIYVTPRNKPAQEILNAITPYLSLATSIIAIAAILSR